MTLQKKTFISLFLIISIGLFFRIFNFSNLVFFSIDQARDFRIISDILSGGIDNFPLLGPKAGGTIFRLGPAFYFLPTLLAWTFGNYPYVLAIPELLLSVLTIPLFFLFLKEFFDLKISLVLTALLSTSLFAIEYAHFSWNPNNIPFFILLAFYSLLKISQIHDRGKYLWLFLETLSASIAMQLHTISMLGIPVIILLYMLFTNNKLNLKHLLFAFFVFSCSVLPIIGNEVLTKGENSKGFIEAFTQRTREEKYSTTGKKLFMTGYNLSQFYSTIITSQPFIKPLARVSSSRDFFDLLKNNSYNIWHLLKGGAFFLLIALSFISLKKLFKKESTDSGKNSQKLNFLKLVIIWQATFLLILFPVSLNLNSRFFLPILFLPIILFGFTIEFLSQKFIKKGNLIIFFTSFLILSNLLGSYNWLRNINSYGTKDVERKEEFILESYFNVTMHQWNNLNDEVEKIYKDQQRNVYIASQVYLLRPALYLLNYERKIPTENFDEESELDSDGLYFEIVKTDKISGKPKYSKKLSGNLQIEKIFNLGTIALLQLKLKNPALHAEAELLKLPANTNDRPRCYQLGYSINGREKCMYRDLFKK